MENFWKLISGYALLFEIYWLTAGWPADMTAGPEGWMKSVRFLSFVNCNLRVCKLQYYKFTCMKKWPHFVKILSMTGYDQSRTDWKLWQILKLYFERFSCPSKAKNCQTTTLMNFKFQIWKLYDQTDLALMPVIVSVGGALGF